MPDNKRPALLIIDMQTGLYDGPEKPYERQRVLDNINQLIQRARHVGVPVSLHVTPALRVRPSRWAARFGNYGQHWRLMKLATRFSIKPGPAVFSAPSCRSNWRRHR